MPLQSLEKSASDEAIVAALMRDGAAIVRERAEPALMDAILGELEPWISRTPRGRDEFTGRKTRRTGSLIARSRSVRDLALDPLILSCAERVLGPHCQRFQLHLSQVIQIGPGETAQDLHRDEWAYSTKLSREMEYELHTLWAATDFTEDNGATRVIPGSHRWERGRRPRREDAVAAAMPKGSAFLYLGSVYHGGGANHSAATRTGISLGFSLGWLRQEENQYLSVPPDVARELPEPLQELIGYSMGGYALGYFGDIQHPKQALARGERRAPPD